MKISAIIVNYNTSELLEDCIKSIEKFTQKIDYEIIVVDNASSDDSVKMVRKMGKITLIANKENVGFSKANNQGIKVAKGDYLLLLNSDTYLEENSFYSMVKYMDQHPEAGIATCRLVNSEKQTTDTGGFFPNILRVFSWMFFLDELPLLEKIIQPYHPISVKSFAASHKRDLYDKMKNRDWVGGAFFMIRRKVIEEIGFLDEKIFMYTEEMEYCYRASLSGWKVGFNPETTVVHLGGKSGTTRNTTLGEYRGLIYYYQKHKPRFQTHLLRLFLKGGSILRIILFGIIKNNVEARKIYEEAYRVV